MFKRYHCPRWAAGLLGLVVLLSLLIPATHAAPRCFGATQQCLDGRFRQYWEQNGGLPVFGFPITAAQDEPNRDTGQTYRTQWLERNRFKLHPENPAPYDVLLGRLGDDRLRQQGRDWQTFPKADPSAAHFFAQTGHAIAHEPFWRFWRTHGLELGDQGISERESLALFGLPLSEPALETNASGATVLTQWFERARFEDHGAQGVLLGLLGREASTAGGMPVPSITPTVGPTHAPPTPTAMPTTRPAPTPARPTPTPARDDCDDAYPTVCIPSPPPDLDCGEIPYRNFRVLPPDPHRFDADKDGVGCET